MARWCAVKLVAVRSVAPHQRKKKPAFEQRVDSAISLEEGADEAKYITYLHMRKVVTTSSKQWMARRPT